MIDNVTYLLFNMIPLAGVQLLKAGIKPSNATENAQLCKKV